MTHIGQCPMCVMKRKKYLEAALGPISESLLAIAPPFYFAQMDLFGPVKVYVQGREKNTRSDQAALDICVTCILTLFRSGSENKLNGRGGNHLHTSELKKRHSTAQNGFKKYISYKYCPILSFKKKLGF